MVGVATYSTLSSTSSNHPQATLAGYILNPEKTTTPSQPYILLRIPGHYVSQYFLFMTSLFDPEPDETSTIPKPPTT